MSRIQMDDFRKWAAAQAVHRQDAVGDFFRDFAEGGCEECGTIATISSFDLHLRIDHGAISAALKARDSAWREYRHDYRDRPTRWRDRDDPLDDERVLAWHDWEEYGGIKYPVLWYTGDGDTEPCIWCGRRHHHGDLEGSRVPHCPDHTHELTAKKNRRSPYARGVTRCANHHREYILRRKPE